MTISELTKTLMAEAGVSSQEEATPEHLQQFKRAFGVVMNRLYNHPISFSVTKAIGWHHRYSWDSRQEMPPSLLPESIILPLMRKELAENAPLWSSVSSYEEDAQKAEATLSNIQQNAGQ